MVNRGWKGIESGDIGFDRGGGVVGFLIRHFSHSPYAHCWVYHESLGFRDGKEIWKTAEAYPGGLKYREREANQVHRVVRLWRDSDERLDILGKSGSLVGAKYNYRELLRIIHYRIRKSFLYFVGLYFALAIPGYFLEWFPGVVMSLVVLASIAYAAIPLQTDISGRVICSNHVAQCVLDARPDVTLTYEPQAIWPGRLEQDLNLVTWHDYLDQERT